MKKYLFPVLLLFLLAGCGRKETVETEQFTAYEVTYLTDARTDSLLISFEIEFPTALANDSVLETVQRSLVGKLFGDRYAELPVEEAMQAFISMYQTEYVQNNKALKEQITDDYADAEESWQPFFCEEDRLAARVIALTDNVLSYGIEQYVYMGGAHGVSSRFFYNYDLQTGALLTEADLFRSGYQTFLTPLLRDSLLAQNEALESLDDLAESGYQVEKIVPNDNFYITPEGMTWLFNPYDIAPYAYGATEIFIPSATLRELLQPSVRLWK